MKKYFNIKIEFNSTVIDNAIQECIKASKKGYVCVVGGNVLAHSYKKPEYNQILNSSTLNICDGISIALLEG
jgi:UDP-N-acetyl-D-mannosaminuronic acid transferase (WecB/TagA/CpsF family)